MATGYFERTDALQKYMLEEAERLIEARTKTTRPAKPVEIADPKDEDPREVENAQTRTLAAKLIDRMAKRDKGRDYKHPGYDDEDS